MWQMRFDLHRAPIPTGSTEREIRADPAMCGVCLNLHPGTAFTALPREGLWVHDSTGWRNAREAEAAGTLAPASELTGRYQMDYTSWETEANLIDMASAASAGCSSCALIIAVVERMGGGSISVGDASVRVVITFCRGLAMRVAVERTTNGPAGDGWDSLAHIWDDALVEDPGQEHLFGFELYTLADGYGPKLNCQSEPLALTPSTAQARRGRRSAAP